MRQAERFQTYLRGGAKVSRLGYPFVQKLLRQKGVLLHRKAMIIGYWVIIDGVVTDVHFTINYTVCAFFLLK